MEKRERERMFMFPSNENLNKVISVKFVNRIVKIANKNT